METVSIIEYSKETNCETNNPIDDDIFVERNSILIPTEDSLTNFIDGEISDYFSENIDTADFEEIKRSIRNLLITSIKANTTPQLTSYKSNDQNNSQEQRQNDENH